ncbi:hypothetical protein [Kitasatospora sp. NBC_01539]|uniref:hypothetical protein n=1 Tax=Kitasatospora sp. NBC_01539 TaxID=2903577 RepID=UPI003860211F
MNTTPTAAQIHEAVAYIQLRAQEDRDHLVALDTVTGTYAESAGRISTALYTATTYLGGILLHQLTRATAPDPRTIEVYWEALAGTAGQWATRPDWPAFLPKPEWAQ